MFCEDIYSHTKELRQNRGLIYVGGGLEGGWGAYNWNIYFLVSVEMGL